MLIEDVFIHSPHLHPKKIFFGGALSQSLKLSEKRVQDCLRVYREVITTLILP